jgi:uncharacterized protein YqeY
VSLIQQLDDRLKAAMKARDDRVLKVIRMVRTRLKEYARDQKLEGEIPDPAVREIVGSYVKQLRKSLPEFEKGGAEAREAIAGIQFEIEYLEPFAPQLLDESQTRKLVAEAVETLGHPPAKMAGRVIGQIMKEHKQEVDAALVRRLVEEALKP